MRDKAERRWLGSLRSRRKGKTSSLRKELFFGWGQRESKGKENAGKEKGDVTLEGSYDTLTLLGTETRTPTSQANEPGPIGRNRGKN
jgi:hypothetical protein